jgi:hypothetical protein
LFVDHVPSREVFRGVDQHLETVAHAEGYEKVPAGAIADRNGRPLFEMFRLRPHRRDYDDAALTP